MHAGPAAIRRSKTALSAIGLAIAAYLVFAEPSGLNGFSTSLLFCPSHSALGVVNCTAVLTSSYSYVFGMPLAGIATAWFLALLLIAILQRGNATLGMLSAYLNIAGVFAVAYSAYAMYEIGKICIYCSGIDIILVALCALGIVEARAILRSM
ncbi:MAG: vitamin K epoxide reductase family protein [Candidatus Micrarchaeaceae archaeon]